MRSDATDAYDRAATDLTCPSCPFAGRALASEGCPKCGASFFSGAIVG
jgi:hypothetical protein